MAASVRDRDDSYPPALRGWYVVAVLLLALTVSFVDRQILSLMVKPVRADLGIDDTSISLLHGMAFVVFYTLMGIPLGRWADRRNRQRLIFTGIVVWSLATVACGYARNFGELFAARVLVGVGEAALSPAAYSLIADYFPRDRRARAMSVYTLGVIAGSGFAMVLGGLAVAATSRPGDVILPLLGAFRPWQAAFVIVGLPGLLVALLVLTIREPVRREVGTGDVSLSGTLAFVRTRAKIYACIALGFGLAGTTLASYAAWLPTLFGRIHGWTPPQIAPLMGISMLTFGLGGVLFGGYLSDRMADRKSGIVGAAVVIVLCCLPMTPVVALAGNPYIALAALCWVNFCVGTLPAMAFPALHGITPNEYRGLVASFYLFGANLVSMGLGPLFVALLTDKVFQSDMAIGWSLAIVTATAVVLGLILLLMARPIYGRYVLVEERAL